MNRLALIVLAAVLILAVSYYALRKQTPEDKLAGLRKDVQAKGDDVLRPS